MERPNIFILYEQNVGVLTPLLADQLRDTEKSYPPEWIDEAFDIAVAANKRSLRYIQAILKRWETEGKNSGETRERDSAESRRRKYTPDELADYQSLPDGGRPSPARCPRGLPHWLIMSQPRSRHVAVYSSTQAQLPASPARRFALAVPPMRYVPALRRRGLCHARPASGDPAFGKAVPCACKQRERLERRLRSVSAMGGQATVRHLTFDSFLPEGNGSAAGHARRICGAPSRPASTLRSIPKAGC